MEKNDKKIRPGESVSDWSKRLKAQAKYEREQEKIDSIKSNPDYGGEINPSVVISTKQNTLNKHADLLNALKPKNWIHLKNYLIRHELIKNKNQNPDSEPTEKKDTVYVDMGNYFKQPTYFADLSKNAYMVHNNVPPDNAVSILGNDFIETDNPHIHTANEWKKMTPDTPITDRNIPLEDFKVFYGVENGTMKIQPLSEFNDTTLVVPGRSKYIPITSIEGLSEEEYKKREESHKILEDQTKKLKNRIGNETNDIRAKFLSNLDSTYFRRYYPNENNRDRWSFGDKVGYDIYTQIQDKYGSDTDNSSRDWLDDLSNNMPLTVFSQDVLKNGLWNPTSKHQRIVPTSRQLQLRNAYRQYYKDTQKLLDNQTYVSKSDSLSRLNKTLDSLYAHAPKQLTFYSGENEISPYEIFNGNKSLIGNGSGAFFIVGDKPKLSQEQIELMRDKINEGGPLTPQLVDSGSFAHYEVNSNGLTPKQREEYIFYPAASSVIFGELAPWRNHSYKKGGKISKLQLAGTIPAATIDNYTNNPPPMQLLNWKTGDVCATDSCAYFSNSSLRDAYGANAWGNAWTLNGKPLYVNPVPKPLSPSKTEYFKYLHKSADRFANDFDFSKLNPNKLYQVNMYYNGSNAWNQAEPTGNGTHAGYLQFKDGKWNVVHNIHKNVYVDTLDDILGGNQSKYGVLNIYEVPGDYNPNNNYIYQLNSYVQNNPMGLWMDNEEASKARMWLVKNNPEKLTDYYNKLTKDQQKKIDPRFKPKK